ncbi:MAG: hypothetical protein IAX21_01965 [Candidatus Bathyarchaeota archaeon]|nr:hypothetical protein [Candidatus Bathyarchaeum tardum]WNZ29661.1 MAG: hypothetical protein IAX21_01965 [Candidatus Bathyarchaeota archaeon]
MSISMDFINLTLGIVGTTAGIVSLAVHLWRLKRETPNLVVKQIKCTHEYEKETKALSFLIELEIRNLGDRGTNILGVDLKFDHKNTEYVMKMVNQDNEPENITIKWIRPHETIRTVQIAFTRFNEKPKKQIPCNLTVYHTHGAEQLKATSTLL